MFRTAMRRAASSRCLVIVVVMVATLCLVGGRMATWVAASDAAGYGGVLARTPVTAAFKPSILVANRNGDAYTLMGRVDEIGRASCRERV